MQFRSVLLAALVSSALASPVPVSQLESAPHEPYFRRQENREFFSRDIKAVMKRGMDGTLKGEQFNNIVRSADDVFRRPVVRRKVYHFQTDDELEGLSDEI